MGRSHASRTKSSREVRVRKKTTCVDPAVRIGGVDARSYVTYLAIDLPAYVCSRGGRKSIDLSRR